MQAVTRVKAEQASKMSMQELTWLKTRESQCW